MFIVSVPDTFCNQLFFLNFFSQAGRGPERTKPQMNQHNFYKPKKMAKDNVALVVLNTLVIAGYAFHLFHEDGAHEVARTLLSVLPFLAYTLLTNKTAFTVASSAFIAYVIFDNEREPPVQPLCKIPVYPPRPNRPIRHVYVPYGYTKDDHWRFIDQMSCLYEPYAESLGNFILVPDVFSDPLSDIYISPEGDEDYFMGLSGEETQYHILRPSDDIDCHGWGQYMVGRLKDSGPRIKAAFEGDVPNPSVLVRRMANLAKKDNCQFKFADEAYVDRT